MSDIRPLRLTSLKLYDKINQNNIDIAKHCEHKHYPVLQTNLFDKTSKTWYLQTILGYSEDIHAIMKINLFAYIVSKWDFASNLVEINHKVAL